MRTRLQASPRRAAPRRAATCRAAARRTFARRTLGEAFACIAALLLAPAAFAQTTPVAGAARIAGHMEVVGADGGHVGTVDRVEAGTIVLAGTDRDAGGRPHAVPIAWIGTVDGKVLLTKPAAEAKAQWDEPPGNKAQGDKAQRGKAQGDRDSTPADAPKR